ncbi:MAG: RidA family protein [Anaerolineales bacterium]|nr:RidA family protein [Anaerolineales bacterium]
MDGAINPASLPEPSGYSYAYRSEGEFVVHFAGHTAMQDDGSIAASDDLVAQVKRVLANLKLTAHAAQVNVEDFSKLTIYVTDVEAYKRASAEIGEAYRAVFGHHFPAITLVEVSRLWDPQALVEIDGVAVV